MADISGAPIISVTPQRLSDTGATFHHASWDMQTLLTSLNGSASALTDSWRGQSRASFDDLWGRWRRSIQDLANALDTLGSLLDQGAVDFTETDQHAMPMTK